MRPTLKQIMASVAAFALLAALVWGGYSSFTAAGALAGPAVPGDQLDLAPTGAAGDERSVEKEWMEASQAMDFGSLQTVPDENDENLLNHAIWYGTMGFDKPYPGEERVLRPHEVPRSDPEASDGEEAEGR